MSVNDWARQEAERQYPALVRREYESYDDFEERLNEHDAAADAYADGIVHAFSALLSDKAMMGAVDLLRGWGYDIGGITWRAALRAAVAAVTEGDTE